MTRHDPRHLPAQRQLRRYILGSFDVLLLMLPPAAAVGLPLGAGSWAVTLPFLLVFTAHCALSARSLHLTVGWAVDERPLAPWVLPALSVTSAGGVALGITSAQASPSSESWPLWTIPTVMVVAACAVAPLVSTRRAILLSLALAAATVLVAWSLVPWPELAPLARLTRMLLVFGLPALVMALSMVLTMRWSVFILRTVDEQSRMESLRADLAVAEERLRIARDMHDVMGRTLTAVALKSDLAAALAEGGAGDRAARESRAIHDLATTSLSELRGVLAGYRRPDLATELAGARALLQSAGVSTRIVGDAGEVPTWAAEPLSWVLREGATNIVRHSDATHATLRLHLSETAATLTLTNDGARPPASSPTRRGRGSGPEPTTRSKGRENSPTAPPDATAGSGLMGLSARLASLGGTLETQVSGTGFTLLARLPRPEETDADPAFPMTPSGEREGRER